MSTRNMMDVSSYLRKVRGRRIADIKYNRGDRGKKTHADGYINLLTRYGTEKDSSTQYQYSGESLVPDMELTDQYESNGLFAKIIDAPAEEVLRKGYDFGLEAPEIKTFIEDELDRLEWEEKATQAIKWSRLYGGAIIVLLADDGKNLEEPLDWEALNKIEDLRVYERAVIEPDYNSIYKTNPVSSRNYGSKFQEPEFYRVNSIYGSFTVHESRCLVLKNGKLPESSMNTTYRFFGAPEYLRIKNALKDAIVAHEDGVKMLDRSVQAIYKMKNLAQKMSVQGGEDEVLKRMEIIDLARGILNTLLIDSDGEDYDFKSMSMAGVKDVIDTTCNMISALTNIPQTILFGRSPAGENSTGASDLENYYNYIEKIQKMMLKKNTRILLDAVLTCGLKDGAIKEIPPYKVNFNKLWSLSEEQQANVDAVKATTEQTKAATAQIYVDMQALDVTEIREGLKKNEEYTINDLLNEEDDLDISSLLGLQEEDTITQEQQEEIGGNKGFQDAPLQNTNEDDLKAPCSNNEPTGATHKDASTNTEKGVGVIVVKDGSILVGIRKDEKGICGPGGHIESGETSEQAAVRETQEEFHIIPTELIPLGEIEGMQSELGSHIFLCTKFSGEPESDGTEMIKAQFVSLPVIRSGIFKVFGPFSKSLELMLEKIGINLDGGPGSGRKPEGGQNKPFDSKVFKKYNEDIKKVKTVTGKQMTGVSKHAVERMQQRNISSDKVKEVLTRSSITYPGNKEGTECYQHDKLRMVVSDSGKLITAIDLSEED